MRKEFLARRVKSEDDVCYVSGFSTHVRESRHNLLRIISSTLVPYLPIYYEGDDEEEDGDVLFYPDISPSRLLTRLEKYAFFFFYPYIDTNHDGGSRARAL